MRETHYIDIDEEIISAVGRLRQSSKGENVFVFPKRALILQSIVNLKLLQREADKLGKKIIVVSQDVAGKKLAEKVGLVVEEYQDQPLGSQASETRPRLTVDTESRSDTPLSGPSRRVTTKRAHAIGSQDFYGQVIAQEDTPALNEAVTPPPTRVLPTAAAQRLRVRNTTPLPLTTLNSARTAQDSVKPLIEKPLLAPPAVPAVDSMQPIHSEPRSSFTRSNLVPSQPRLQRFMTKTTAQATFPVQEMTLDQPAEETVEKPVPREPKEGAVASPNKSFVFGTSLVVMLLLGVLGVGGWYVLFPKAAITLIPQVAEQVVRYSFTGVTDGTRGDFMVPVRVVTIEKTVRVSDTATGAGTGGDNKVRGKIRIYNDFSTAAQPLVATTRFETKEGKIFRLLQAVVVPGLSEKNGGKHEPGVVEAVVVADQPSSDTLPPNTLFTIPGFKGSPKYAAFRAESLQAFGGGGAQSETKVISQADVDRVAAKALAEARTLLLESAQLSLSPGEVLIEPSLVISEKSKTNTPLIGLTADNFDFEGRYEAKVFVVTSESTINDRIAKETQTSNGVTLVPRQHTIGYTQVLPKFDQGQLEMTVESTIQFHSTLDISRLQQGLLGLDEEGIKAFLHDHPEIARLQVEFDPQFIIATIPTDEDRVKVQVAE